MKRYWGIILIILFGLSGCKIEYNSPQSARDDNYGAAPESTSSMTSEESIGAEIFSAAGSGEDVFTHLPFKKGVVVMTYSYTGQGHFLVMIVAANGETISTPVDKTGQTAGKVLVTLPKDADNYLLQISAEGAWQVKFAKADPLNK
jgi:hypothetical protein